MDNKFRFDINALRAFAVVSVVFFHFNIPYFQGGFVGVDVFFVISGFLMARIVCGSVLSNKFSLVDFYLSRARRIWPALFVLSAVLLVFGWFVLITSDYKILGRHVRESVFFTSNLRYFSEAGYFDHASNTKWLLHTWSLSVEWQFYILYPLFVLSLYKVFKSYRLLFFIHVFMIIVSFVISYLYAITDSSKAFYVIESRAWEMLLGGLLFFVHTKPSENIAKAFNYFGFLILFVSIFLIDEAFLWPSPYALLPTLGTFFIILADFKSGFVVKSKVVQWLGERSYSIYLWHWPLVVFMGYYNVSNIYVVFYIALSFFIGHMSYKFIETPTRKALTQQTKKKSFLILLGCLISLAASAQYIRKTGVSERLPDEIQHIEQMADDKNPRQNECLSSDASCVFGGFSVSAILLGDSHADSIVTALEQALPVQEQGVMMRAASACLFVKGAKMIKNHSESCEKLVGNMSAELNAGYKNIPIVIANRLAYYLHGEHKSNYYTSTDNTMVDFLDIEFDGLNIKLAFETAYLNTMCELAKNNPVFVLRPVPEMPFDVPREMARDYVRGVEHKDIKMPVDDYHQRNVFVDQLLEKASTQCGVKVLNPEPFLCDSSFCYGSKNGLALYVDDDHLSEYGNKRLVELFKTVFTGD